VRRCSLTTAKTLARLAAAALVAAPALAGCTDWAGYDIDMAAGKVPQLATMRRSVIPDPYEMARLPAANTVPVSSPNGDTPASFSSAKLDSVAPTLRNPLRPTPEVLARGELQYHTNCFVCHGVTGDGKGPVAQPGKVVGIPAINGANTAARSDGYIYGVIVAGRGLMPPYGSRITEADRWAIVEYVRHLQEQGGARPARGGATTAAPAALGQGVPAPAPTEAGTQIQQQTGINPNNPPAAAQADTAGTR
jgi:mono/diheme cytochrome c family protein